MSSDIKNRLRAYYQAIDETQEPVTHAEVIDGREELDTRPSSAPIVKRRRALVFVVAVLGVLLGVGVPMLLISDDEAPPAVSPSPTSVVQVSCDSSGNVSLSSSVVSVMPDGVHVEILPTGEGPPMSVWITLPSVRMLVGTSRPTETVAITLSDMAVLTGDRDIACIEAGQPLILLGEDYEHATLTIADPEGVWVPTALACEEVGGGSNYRSDRVDVTGVVATDDIARAIHERTPGLSPDDVVELAGYPEAESPAYRAIRNGRVLARFQPESPDIFVFDTCHGSGVGLQSLMGVYEYTLTDVEVTQFGTLLTQEETLQPDLDGAEVVTRLSLGAGRWTQTWVIDGRVWEIDGQTQGAFGTYEVVGDQMVLQDVATLTYRWFYTDGVLSLLLLEPGLGVSDEIGVRLATEHTFTLVDSPLPDELLSAS